MTVETLVTDTLCSNAERLAEAAEQLPAFSGFKLLHVKRELTTLLAHIGREKIFAQFTRHDITHINKMLHMLDWVIPKVTQDSMTPADWLLTVLSIYFHDLGMLVTREEFDSRSSSAFPEYVRTTLLSGTRGQDLKRKLESFDSETRERFLYQEYIRHIHAHRIRSWVSGENQIALGDASSVVGVLESLLLKLPDSFRRDLGTVCESHHFDDLHDGKKYHLSQPYGDTPSETANLQYAAVLLRTVDLLHMTLDRTPSVEFHLIAPTDPISQQEWAKQMAVTSVRSQAARDGEGNVDPSLTRHVIEVHADFKKPDGFFALTTFLAYVQGQLRLSHEWVAKSRKDGALSYHFPWRDIDDSRIETRGFLKEQFEFSLDQRKILDLLTGQTIYNNGSVALRELVQNGIDAVRIHAIDVGRASGEAHAGSVDVRWFPQELVLEVQDNGTGMSQAVIEKHLLRAGSSRYQDDAFRKLYPEFSPISRFGIGILSCFMISDDVEIFTSHPSETEARHLSLRSVHGKYLIRLLDKREANVGPNGTRVRLRVRPSADLDQIENVLRFWMVVPHCRVTFSADGAPPS